MKSRAVCLATTSRLEGWKSSAAMLGLAQAAYEAASAYSTQREQFGRQIATFQGVAFKVADMATQIDAARLMVYRAAWLKDQGKDFGLAAA